MTFENTHGKNAGIRLLGVTQHCILQGLFFKTKTVNFREKSTGIKWGDVIAGGPGNRPVSWVIGFIERKTGLANAQGHFTLNRFKIPRHIALERSIKPYFDRLV